LFDFPRSIVSKWGAIGEKNGLKAEFLGSVEGKKANLGVISVICRNPADFVAASLTVATKKRAAPATRFECDTCFAI